MIRSASAQHDEAAAAHLLYRSTLDLLRWSDDPARERHVLLVPLSRAVAAQHTRAGQLLCACLVDALACSDYDAALDACIALVELAAPLEAVGETDRSARRDESLQPPA